MQVVTSLCLPLEGYDGNTLPDQPFRHWAWWIHRSILRGSPRSILSAMRRGITGLWIILIPSPLPASSPPSGQRPHWLATEETANGSPHYLNNSKGMAPVASSFLKSLLPSPAILAKIHSWLLALDHFTPDQSFFPRRFVEFVTSNDNRYIRGA